MAVIPKRVVGGISTRLHQNSRIVTVVLDDDGSSIETDHLDRGDLIRALQGRRVASLVVAPQGSAHLAVVEAAQPGRVRVRLRCRGWMCGDHGRPSDETLPARSEVIVEQIAALIREADCRVAGRAGRRGRWQDVPAWVEPVDIEEGDEDYGEWTAGVGSGTEVPVSHVDDAAPADGLRSDELEDLVDPPLCWGPRFDRLRDAVARVAAGTDHLADLLPDADACTVRSHGRRLAAGLAGLRVSDGPLPGAERRWIAEQLRVPGVPERPIADVWADLGTPDRASIYTAVEGVLALFDGTSGSAAPWCHSAVELLDAAAPDVPPTVRGRVEDPLELVASAASALAARAVGGQVPGRDITGVDLWFAAGGAVAEFAARGPIIGANEHGELAATGLVVVVGDRELRHRFIDAVELGADQRPTVRVVQQVRSGPHLAALATTRGSRPVLLNSASARSPFAVTASLPHLRHSADVEQESRRVAERWASITPVGRDGWWESMPHTYLPALLHALMLEGADGLCAGSVVPTIDEERLEELQGVCRRAGRHDVADRLSGIVEYGIAGSTKASVRISISAAVPQDPPPCDRVLDRERLHRRAVILPGDAVATMHAATDLAEMGCDVLWDDVDPLDRGVHWCARHPGALTILGYPTLSAVDLPADVLRSATVVGLHGCGDLSPLTGRSVEVDPTEAALVRRGTLTMADPVHRLLATTVTDAHRDAFVRSCARLVRGGQAA